MAISLAVLALLISCLPVIFEIPSVNKWVMDTLDHLTKDDATAKKMRDQGFGSASVADIVYIGLPAFFCLAALLCYSWSLCCRLQKSRMRFAGILMHLLALIPYVIEGVAVYSYRKPIVTKAGMYRMGVVVVEYIEWWQPYIKTVTNWIYLQWLENQKKEAEQSLVVAKAVTLTYFISGPILIFLSMIFAACITLKSKSNSRTSNH